MTWLREYRREWLRPDVVAGLTTAAVVIPKAMAYAAIAGLPVQAGLYTAFVPMMIYAVLGTSRPLSTSTTTTIAILTGAVCATAAPNASDAELVAVSATLAVGVGLILCAARVLRLGFLANFISEPVLTGFKAGIGVVIVVDQLPKLLGIHIDKAGFFRDLAAIVAHVPEASVPTVVLGAVLLVLIFGLERVLPRLPAPLIGVALAIAASAALGLDAAGVETVAEIPRGLPALMWPDPDLALVLWPAAAGIALMSFTETIAAARAFGEPDEPRPVPDQELLAIGVANVASGLFGAMAAGGGTSQTAVNRGAGARSQLAGVVSSLTALATLVVLAPVISLLPLGALAAVVIATSIGLIDLADFREIRRVRRAEFRWAVAAWLGVVLLGTLQGILVAVVLSLVSLAQQAWDPPVYALGRKRGTTVFRPLSSEHPDDERWPGLLLVRVEGRAFFANAQAMGEKIWALVADHRPKVVVIDLSAVIDLEYTALKMLTEGEERGERQGIELWLAALNPSVFEVVQRSRLGQKLGQERMFLSVDLAVARYERRGAAA